MSLSKIVSSSFSRFSCSFLFFFSCLHPLSFPFARSSFPFFVCLLICFLFMLLFDLVLL